MKIRTTYKIILAACLLLINSSCSTKKAIVKNQDGSFSYENKYGLYTYHLKKSLSLNDPVVYGSVYEFNRHIEKLQGSKIIVDKNTIHKTGKTGDFTFNVMPGRHRFRGLAVTYLQLGTKPFKLLKGDSLSIIFNLKNPGPYVD